MKVKLKIQFYISKIIQENITKLACIVYFNDYFILSYSRTVHTIPPKFENFAFRKTMSHYTEYKIKKIIRLLLE